MLRDGINHFGPAARKRTDTLPPGQSPPNRILFDVSLARLELLEITNLYLVEPSFPHFSLALQSKRETALDELERLFERNIWSWRQQKMEMVWHNHEGAQFEAILASIAPEHVEHQ